MAERVLTTRELNRAVLARQHLLEPSTGSIARTLTAVGGLQAQYAPSMYVGLWSRMRELERDDVTRALQRRGVVQATLMRITIHLVATRDFWPFALATRRARRERWLRAMGAGTTPADLEERAGRVREHLTRHATISRKDLDALVGKPYSLGIGQWIDLVRAPPSGTWERRRADLFALAEDWVGPPPPELTEHTAVEHLLRGYLRGFGPATRADIVSYTGLPKPAVAQALARLNLRGFRGEAGDELLDLPRAPLPDSESPIGVRFLPTWDATPLVHARRARILPEEHRPKIFHVRNPHSDAVFLVDGAVAGTWRFRDGEIELNSFEPLDPATKRELRAAADRLRAFHT